MNNRYQVTLRRVAIALLLLSVLIASGTLAFMLFEGFSFWDAIYMTVITISTVGYREVKPLTLTGRIIAMILIILGVGLVFYTFGAVLEYFFGDFSESTLKQRRALARTRKRKTTA